MPFVVMLKPLAATELQCLKVKEGQKGVLTVLTVSLLVELLRFYKGIGAGQAEEPQGK